MAAKGLLCRLARGPLPSWAEMLSAGFGGRRARFGHACAALVSCLQVFVEKSEGIVSGLPRHLGAIVYGDDPPIEVHCVWF